MNLANCVKRQSNTTWERAGGIELSALAELPKSENLGIHFSVLFLICIICHCIILLIILAVSCLPFAAAIDLGGDGFSFSYYKIHI